MILLKVRTGYLIKKQEQLIDVNFLIDFHSKKLFFFQSATSHFLKIIIGL